MIGFFGMLSLQKFGCRRHPFLDFYTKIYKPKTHLVNYWRVATVGIIFIKIFIKSNMMKV